MSNEVTQEQIDSLLYKLSTRKASNNDISFIINNILFCDNNLNLNTTEIINYLTRNYGTGLRNFILQKLEEDSSNLLELLDKKFLVKTNTNDILTLLKGEDISCNCEETIQVSIKYSIDLFISENNIVHNNIPGEFLFYLYIISLIQTDKREEINASQSILKAFQPKVDFTKLLRYSTSLNQINPDLIITMFNSNDIVIKDKNKYFCYVKSLEFILVPIQETNLYQRIQDLNNIFSLFKINSLQNSLFVPILLDYCDNIFFQDVKLYFSIFEFLLNKTSSKTKGNNDLILIKWIITKISQLNIDCSYFTNGFLSLMKKSLANVFSDSKSIFLSQILPKFFIQITNNFKSQKKLFECYHYCKNIISDMKFYSNLPIQVKFAAFYFKLISKIEKKQLLSVIKLDSTKVDLYFDVYCIFMLMNSQTQELIKDILPFSTMLDDINNNKIINPFNYKTNDFDPNKCSMNNPEHVILNKLIKNNIIQHSKISLSFFLKKHSSNSDMLNHIKIKDYPHILILNILNENQGEFKFNLEQLLKHQYNKKEITKEGKTLTYWYIFKGIFMINENNRKDVKIYDKNSLSLFSIENSHWTDNITIDSKVKTLKVIYFRKVDNFSNNEFYGKIGKIEPLENGTERDLYWNALKKIITINPLLLKNHLDFYMKWLSFENISDFMDIYNTLLFKNKFQENNENKLLMLSIIYKRKKILNLKEKDISSNQIEKDLFFFEPNLFSIRIKDSLMKRTNLKDNFQKTEFFWNINYYSQNINSIPNVPSMIGFFVTVIILRNKITQNKNKDFFDNFLKNLSVLPTFNPEKIDEISNIYTQLNGNTKLKALISFWEEKKLLLLDDYKLKFISELLILSVQFNRGDPESYIKSFIQRNNQIISMIKTNDKDIKLMFKILIEFVFTKCGNEEFNFYELMSTCFNSSSNMIQYSDFQKLFIHNYLDCLIKDSKFDILLEEVLRISNVIFEEKDLQKLFINILSQLKDKKKFPYDKLKQTIIDLYSNTNSSKHNELRISLILFYMYIKIETTKNKIENFTRIKLSSNNNMDVLIIFLFFNKQFRQIISTQKETCTITKLYQLFKQEQIIIDLTEMINLNYSSKNINDIIQQELAFINNELKEQCFYFQQIKTTYNKKLKSTTLVNDNKHLDYIPYILYFHNINIDTNPDEKFPFSNREYELKGIILYLKNSVHKVILLKNKHNSYWYSIYEKKWIYSINNYLQNEVLIDKMFTIYYLVNKEQKANELVFENIFISSKKYKCFEKHFMIEMKWLLKNAINDLIANSQKFIYIFKLNDGIKQWKMLEISDIPWDSPIYKNFLETTKMKSFIEYLRIED